MASVFALPVPPSQSRSSIATIRAQKRKRGTEVDQAIESEDEAQRSEEYRAVLTPDERAQRRLAGHSLVQELPHGPFPHRAPPSGLKLPGRIPTDNQTNDADADSLRIQHISAMSAVLHKCLLKKDYVRARHALGLLLRTDVHGKPIDIRAAGNWAIGAEILFRQYDRHLAIGSRHERLRRGFLEAKALYEMLIIQYPPHRTWPDSVNAVDFYLSMFSLWIYVAQAEGQHAQNAEEGDHNDTAESADVSRTNDIRDIKIRELKQANDIAARMDKCMTSAAYSNNPDLLRLRNMVAEWQADLIDDWRSLAPGEELESSESWPPAENIATVVDALNLSESNTTTSQQAFSQPG